MYAIRSYYVREHKSVTEMIRKYYNDPQSILKKINYGDEPVITSYSIHYTKLYETSAKTHEYSISLFIVDELCISH